MKVFIFGAGASQGSQDGYVPNVKAPLVNQLFDTEFDANYTDYAKNLGFESSDLAKYQEAFKQVGDLEGWLTSLWEEHDVKVSQFARQRNRAMFGRITFYVWWMMQNVSNTYSDQNGYRLFLEKLGDEEHGFINFNYDTLLDRALVEAGFNLGDNLSTYAGANYSKPHAPVNWFLRKRHTDVSIGGEQSYDSFARIKTASNGLYIDTPLPFDLRVYQPSHHDLDSIGIMSSSNFDYQYAYPFILIPLTTKLYGHFEKFKENVIDTATHIAGKADEIYLVGYRASDDVIRDILSEVKQGTLLHVVGRDGASATQSEVLKWKPDMKAGEVYSDGFMAFIEQYDS